MYVGGETERQLQGVRGEEALYDAVNSVTILLV